MLEDDAAVLVLALSGVRVVVEARSIGAIAEADRVDGARSDLAAWLGLDATGARRRALRVEGHDAWVVVGDEVAVRRIRDDAYRPLPEWIAGVAERLSLSALVALDDGFGFAMDLDRFLEDEAASPPEPTSAPTSRGALL